MSPSRTRPVRRTAIRGRSRAGAPSRTRQPVSASARGRDLVIVESPAKARTIGPLLGQSFAVRASIGHVRDLPKSRLGVDTERDFEPRYLVPQDKRQVVKELKAAAKEASAVYLATDPDREGEAIAWHLIEAAELQGKPLRRVAFHEITPEAIREAFQHPREIDMDLVQAQQARRVLDRLVGYSLSPILWRKVRGRLSAGRVQSAALRMVVEREREIQAFVAQEYWTIEAVLGKEGAQAGQGRRRAKQETFSAELVNLAGQRGRIHIPDAARAEELARELRPADYRVKGVATKKGVRQPEPPFTTSTLQQEAARRLRFTAQRTMAVAQQLYEGLDVGERAPVGLITYMRTDSVQVAESAIHQTRAYIQSKFGADFLPRSPRRFTRRARGAQEAHEAIRPTSVVREPAALRGHLTADQYRLYDLIWKRMVASQMAIATTETTTVDVEARNEATGNLYLLRAAATRVVFPGFQILYQEGRDDDERQDTALRQAQDTALRQAQDTAGAGLPALAAGEPLRLAELEQRQHFTQPPPRYSDATLIRALEANGIGRPSTYASILTTLQERGYVRRESRQFVPQELGFIVNDLLTEHFSEVVDLQFTAKMEEELDDIAAGKRQWVPVIREFYNPFHQALEQADTAIEKVHFEPEPTGELCEQCGKPMVYRMGRYGRFQACSGFPQCRNTKPILKLVGVKCPKDAGDLAEKRARARGRLFYGCANFPACDFTTWEKPLPDPCPQCGGLRTQPRAGVARCSQCGHTEQAARRSAPRRSRVAQAEPVAAGVVR